MTRAGRARPASAQIEVHIGELMIDDLGTGSPDVLVAALTTELQVALARQFPRSGQPREAARAAALSAPRVRVTMALPSAGEVPGAVGAGTAAGVGTALGAALGRAVAGPRELAGPQDPARLSRREGR